MPDERSFRVTLSETQLSVVTVALDTLSAGDEESEAENESAKVAIRAARRIDEAEPHEAFTAEQVERAGWLTLYWSGIDARDTGALDEFLEAIGNSSIPEAAGTVGASIVQEEGSG